MSMESLCKLCDVCTFMPRQIVERDYLVSNGEKPRVLVIDDMLDSAFGFDSALLLLGTVPFDYTKSIRCYYTQADVTPKEEQTALGRCSVWTKSIVGNYAVYVITKKGLDQLGIGEARSPGEAFVNPRLGLVLCTIPLAEIGPSNFSAYKSKLDRLLKKAGIQ